MAELPPPHEPAPRSAGSEFAHRWQQLKASGALTSARDTHRSSAPSAGRVGARNWVWLAVGATAVVVLTLVLLFLAVRR